MRKSVEGQATSPDARGFPANAVKFLLGISAARVLFWSVVVRLRHALGVLVFHRKWAIAGLLGDGRRIAFFLSAQFSTLLAACQDPGGAIFKRCGHSQRFKDAPQSYDTFTSCLKHFINWPIIQFYPILSSSTDQRQTITVSLKFDYHLVSRFIFHCECTKAKCILRFFLYFIFVASFASVVGCFECLY